MARQEYAIIKVQDMMSEVNEIKKVTMRPADPQNLSLSHQHSEDLAEAAKDLKP